MPTKAPTDLRSQFPALAQEVNGKPLAYLDNASTTQRPAVVLEAMQCFYQHDNANVHRGVHALSQRATDEFDAARSTVAKFIHASNANSVIFTKGCTESINLVAATWGFQNIREGDRVLVSTMEHHANIVPWQVATERAGAVVEPVPIFDDCSLDMEALESMLKKGRAKVVAVKHVCNASGTVNPIGEITKLAHEHGAVVMIDGAQGLAHQAVDVQALDVDFYSIASHKVYGPMGFGALYGKPEHLEGMPPYQTGGGMIRSVSFEETIYAAVPDKFEPGTPNVAGAIGLARALDWVTEVGLDRIQAVEHELGRSCTEQLQDVPGVRIIGTAPGKASIVSFVMEQAHPHDVGTILDSEGVAVRTGQHCCHPLLDRMGVPATTRASISVYNNEEDIDSLMRGVKRVAQLFG
ncbi:MAG: SufS family cysteine desulfurase [Armatimonadetes bacterium]|nr:SufS family cysteine desulfurase [Armatimonadota bacterium]